MEDLERRFLLAAQTVEPRVYATRLLAVYERAGTLAADSRNFDIQLFLAEEYGFNDQEIPHFIEELRSIDAIRVACVKAGQSPDDIRHSIIEQTTERVATADQA